MSPSPHAVQLFARLVAHWPALGGNDQMAKIRADDWCRAIGRSDPKVAAVTCDELVDGWAGSFPPKIADWQSLARQKALHLLPPTPALEAPEPDPERLAPLLEQARAQLTVAKAKTTPPVKAEKLPRKELGPIDPDGKHMPTYDEVYGPVPEKENAE